MIIDSNDRKTTRNRHPVDIAGRPDQASQNTDAPKTIREAAFLDSGTDPFVLSGRDETGVTGYPNHDGARGVVPLRVG